MSHGRMPLPDTHWEKAAMYMRAFRRALMDYWYSTMEDKQAAVITAAQACIQVNILDETVFKNALGDPYCDLRAKDRQGKVVMGLELIRNCETHASVVFDSILTSSMAFGVPTQAGTILRSVYTWAVDGYRKAVHRRSVIETLFDAMAFFQSLDQRLAGPPPPKMRWSYGEPYVLLPDTDPQVEQPGAWFISRPMGLDQFETFLPDIACRPFERRSAQWPTADKAMKELVAASKKEPPRAHAREVLHALVQNGKILGYSGYTSWNTGQRSTWVERRAQVRRDIRAGYRYYVSHGGGEIDLQPHGHQELIALDSAGQDILRRLPSGQDSALGTEYLRMVEGYPDLYLDMRRRDG